jgi:hypothetical protein
LRHSLTPFVTGGRWGWSKQKGTLYKSKSCPIIMTCEEVNQTDQAGSANRPSTIKI